MNGMFAGGATVPGRALIETLPLVWQTVMKSVLWQVGRATATGGVISSTIITKTVNTTNVLE